MPTPYTTVAQRFKEKRVALIGGGIEIEAMAPFIAALGAREIVLLDKKEVVQLPPALTHLPRITGPGYLDTLATFDIAVRSPGVPYLTPAIQQAQQHGVEITSMTKLFFELCPAPIIGITGSNGKTTTTNLAAHLLRAGTRRVLRGGNDATPLINQITEIQSNDLVVLELSSFQLQDLTVSPHIAVITNITPNHLDTHASFEEYTEAKRQIFAHQSQSDIAIVNGADPASKDLLTRAARYTVAPDGSYHSPNGTSGMPIALPSDGVPFVTAASNVATALIIARQCGISEPAITAALKTFMLPPQRLEVVRTLDGVTYINDSSCTTPESAIVGLRAFPIGRVVLIAGGRNKGMSFDALAQEIVTREATAVLMGESAQLIHDAILRIATHYPITIAGNDFPAVIRTAQTLAGLGQHKYVLLSPACASFDMFQNAKERGAVFTKLVQEL